MASSPTKRTLTELRALGLTAQVTEHWNAFARIRQDLYGFIDVLALGEGYALGVQACAAASHAARKAKILAHPNFPKVLAAGIVVELWSWGKRCSDGRGSRKTWQVRKERLTIGGTQ